MPIPDFQAIMLPLLAELHDQREREMRELTTTLADRFGLTDSERQERLASGSQTIIINRVSWARTHMKNAGLVADPSRGKVAITAEGLNVLAQKPEQINCRFLKQYPTYLSFIGQNPDDSAGNPATPAAIIESIVTPQEQIDASFQALRKATGEELLERLRKCSPGFFEIVVVRLLQALGYGATGEALVTGKSGDGGVDGIIKEDKLGLDVVCVQAKRWEATVGRPVVQAFVGSMDFVRARKGVVITTSNFSREAFDYVERIGDKKVVLIDGNRLTGLMIDYGVGVTVSKRYELKDVSSDFFGEDME